MDEIASCLAALETSASPTHDLDELLEKLLGLGVNDLSGALALVFDEVRASPG
jgi:hypothetical protein